MIKIFKVASMVLLPVVLMSVNTLSHASESCSDNNNSESPRTMCTTDTLWFSKGSTVYFDAEILRTLYSGDWGDETETDGHKGEIRIMVNNTTYWGKKIRMTGEKSGSFTAPGTGHLKLKIITDYDTNRYLYKTYVYVKLSKTAINNND